MRTVFADTSYYVAALNARDALHAVAAAFTHGYKEKYLTTEFVLLETATFFTRPDSRAAFVRLVRDLQADDLTTIVPASPDLFAARPDKEWSLTDCTSFVVMTDAELTDALTADHHFAQAGFNPLLADPAP